MEPMIEQALQQGIAAHKEGKLQDAERLYRLILQTQPQHPDANHNLGLIAVSVDQAAAALPLFKVAVEANPKIEQFWLAYIDALIKAQQFKIAQQVIGEAKRSGVAVEKLIALQAQLTSMNKSENADSTGPSQIQRNTLLEHYQNGRYIDAEKLALSLTQEFPEHPLSWKVLGTVLSQTGRNSEAIHANEIAVVLSPQDAEAHDSLGVTLQELGRLDEAEASHRQAITIKPDLAEAHYNWGNTLKKMGRLDEAEASYRQAIVLKPAHAKAHYNQGLTLQELGRLEEAEASYRQAVAFNPDFPEAHSNLGNTLKALRKLEEAETSYKQAIVFNPSFAEGHYNLSVTLQELGKLEEAEASYRQTIALKPDFAEAQYNLGLTLQELGRLDEAEAFYRQAIVLKPDFVEAYYNLGNTLQKLGRVDDAKANYRQAIALNSDYVEAHLNLGNTLKELGKLDKAVASYTHSIALKPDLAEAHHNLGLTLQQLGRLNEAEASYMQAIALKPDYAEAHDNLGNILIELGRLDEAKVSYTQAIALKDNCWSAKHMLSAITGETTATAPRDYVEGLFNSYSANFESSLVNDLEYKIHKVIVQMLLKNHRGNSLGSVLDLGCGTGLTGLEIKPYCEYLEGIDLSEKMLKEATKKNVYNKLAHLDIKDYLTSGNLYFDYFISTDVFVYVGDLTEIFRLIKHHNKTGGRLVFSVEDHDGDGFFLEQSGRYSHSKQYINSLCEKFGYKLSYFQNQNIRKEKDRYIKGCLYLLDF